MCFRQFFGTTDFYPYGGRVNTNGGQKMSLSSDHFKYHLTPAGWIAGSEKLDWCAETDVPKPADALLTVNEHRKISHWSAGEDVDCYEIWRSPDTKAVEQAIEKFGDKPAISPPFKPRKSAS